MYSVDRVPALQNTLYKSFQNYTYLLVNQIIVIIFQYNSNTYRRFDQFYTLL